MGVLIISFTDGFAMIDSATGTSFDIHLHVFRLLLQKTAMTETPPMTPSRQKILVTPMKYSEHEEGNEANALNFANMPIRSKHDHSKQQSISYMLFSEMIFPLSNRLLQ